MIGIGHESHTCASWKTVFLKCFKPSKAHWSHVLSAFIIITISIWMSVCDNQSVSECQCVKYNRPKPHKVSAPKPSGTSTGICTGTLQNLNPPEPHQVSAPEPSGTSTGICTETLQNLTRALRNLTRYLHRNPPEPHQVSALEPSGTSTRYLHQNLNPPEPHQVSAREPSGTSTGICTGTLGTLPGTWCWSCTGSHQS